MSWLVVSIWSLFIFLTIPLARTIGKFVSEQWGKELFTYVVLAAIAVALAAAVYYVVRYRPAASGGRFFWLIVAAAIFAGYTIQLGKRSPEEAIHFIQYGVLGILVYRALAIQQHDITIYFSAAVICGIIGTFRSRLSPDELRNADLERATEAAAILNIYRDRSGYKDFLSIYTPVNDPFLHEARVHLFSRDTNLSRAIEIGQNSDYYALLLTTAYRENQIMEKYFPNTLRSSDYVWHPGKLATAEKYLLQDKFFKSWVSRHLITSVTEAQVGLFFALLVLGLVLLSWYLKKY